MRKIITFTFSLILLISFFSFSPKKSVKKLKFIQQCYESSVMAGAMYAAAMNMVNTPGYIIYENVPPTHSGTAWCFMITYDVNPNSTKQVKGK